MYDANKQIVTLANESTAMFEKLADVVAGDQAGFQLRVGYSLKLSTSLMGYFPAIFTDSRRIILVFDRMLLGNVWAMLPPRESEVVEYLFFVNLSDRIAFPVGGTLAESIDGKFLPVLTAEEFEECKQGQEPFEWAHGLMGGARPSVEEYERLRQAALVKLH